MALDRAVAAVRLAVRRDLLAAGGTDDGSRVMVACSGGADSLALLAATVFEARERPWYVLGATVDHGLQEGSADRADRVVAQMAGLGVDETASVRVDVTAAGLGPEAAAREARYAALTELAERAGCDKVLLGHTLDDQAETVLLGLTRGSGARSVAGMRPAFGSFRRPLLGVTRAQTEAACRADGIDVWDDPHNDDPRYTRTRVRHRVMPVLERELGPGVAAALARTADLLRADAASLDRTAEGLLAEVSHDDGLDVASLATLDDAVRLRLLRLAALRAGSPPGELFRVHLVAVDELVTAFRGQQRIELPGHVSAVRQGGVLAFRRTDRPGV